MRDNSELFRKTVEIQTSLTADFVDEIFDLQYDPEDSNRCSVEQKNCF